MCNTTHIPTCPCSRQLIDLPYFKGKITNRYTNTFLKQIVRQREQGKEKVYGIDWETNSNDLKKLNDQKQKCSTREDLTFENKFKRIMAGASADVSADIYWK